MTYETIDWEAEAQRVARAFGVEEKCRFVKMSGDVRILRPATEGKYKINVPDGEGDVAVSYQPQARTYQIFVSNEVTAAVIFPASGAVKTWIKPDECIAVKPLARALFHLGLLTPQVESKMKVTISNHEKLEWSLEYEARFNS